MALHPGIPTVAFIFLVVDPHVYFFAINSVNLKLFNVDVIVFLFYGALFVHSVVFVVV